jgi:hypothetical protein
MLVVEGRFTEVRWQSDLQFKEVHKVCFDKDCSRALEQACGQSFKRVNIQILHKLGLRSEVLWAADFKAAKRRLSIVFTEKSQDTLRDAGVDHLNAALHAQIRKAAVSPKKFGKAAALLTAVSHITDRSNPVFDSRGEQFHSVKSRRLTVTLTTFAQACSREQV